jgi:hypothetical protein
MNHHDAARAVTCLSARTSAEIDTNLICRITCSNVAELDRGHEALPAMQNRFYHSENSNEKILKGAHLPGCQSELALEPSTHATSMPDSGLLCCGPVFDEFPNQYSCLNKRIGEDSSRCLREDMSMMTRFSTIMPWDSALTPVRQVLHHTKFKPTRNQQISAHSCAISRE